MILLRNVSLTFRNNIIFISFPKKGNLQCIVQRLCKHKGIPFPESGEELPELQVVQFLAQFLKKVWTQPLLVIIDDIRRGSESVLDWFDFIPGSGHRKILVTSRLEIPRFGIPFHLYGLSEDEAMALFCHSAGLAYFDKEDRNKSRMREGMTEFTTEARQIVSHCSGSPLAITVVGKSLCGKPAHVWRRKAFELDYHNTILDTDITFLLCLQSTFEDMDKELQAAYLDLAVLPNKFLDCLGTAVDVWAELHSHLLDDVLFCTTTFHELSAWHLVFLQYSLDKRFFQNERIDDYWFRHVDLFREYACCLASLDPIEERQRLILEVFGKNIPKWLRELKDQPLKAQLLSISTGEASSSEWPDLNLPEVKVLALHIGAHVYHLARFVEKMHKLGVLAVDAEILQFLEGGQIQFSDFELLAGLSNLQRIRLENLSINLKGSKPSQLRSVKKLDIKSCSFMSDDDLPLELCDMFPNLVLLSITNCFVSIADLNHLRSLSLIDRCPMKMWWSSDWLEYIGDLINLEILKIASPMNKLRHTATNLKKLGTLDLSD